MIVKAVENNTEDAELTDQYNKLAAKITEQLQSQGKNLDGFLAYNVSLQMQMAIRLNRPTKLLTALLIKKLLHRN